MNLIEASVANTDVPTYESDDEQISWKSSDDEDESRVSKDEDDDDQKDDDDQSDDDERTDSDNDDIDEEIHGVNVEGDELNEEETNEEDEGDELYRDVNGQQQSSSVSSGFISNMLNPSSDTCIDYIINLNTESTLLVDVPVTTIVEPSLLSATTLPPPPTPLITHLQQTPVPTPATVPSSSLQDLPNFGSFFGFEHRLKTLEIDFSEFKQTNQFVEAVSSIPGIVDSPVQPWISNLAQKDNSCDLFNEMMDTPLDFSAFVMNQLMVDTLTPELLTGLTFKQMKGSCKILVELKYFFEEVYKATTNQLDWNNPEGQQYPHDLQKPLPLIPNSQGRRVIAFDNFINNDLEYLSGGVSSQKYTTSVTKTKAADYRHIKWIEDLVLNGM
uniref:Uncharacterized protein n=1 Tax=Tanacetum cinerariifolium TaxID=118510 RepID=A0A6L2P9J0_TANCI|nr:hypothetical protein [Tanacetum cinerariifolium]